MKKIWVILAIVFLAAPFLGCQQEAQLKLASMLNFSPVKITGEVGKENYKNYAKIRMTKWGIEVPESVEYCINIEIENKLFGTLAFKNINVKIIPENGNPLYTTMGQTKGKGIFEVPAGKKEIFEFSTSGFADSLIADSGGKPLIFEITLKDGSNVVAGPFVAPLPDIKTLRFCNKNEKLTPLEFSPKEK